MANELVELAEESSRNLDSNTMCATCNMPLSDHGPAYGPVSMRCPSGHWDWANTKFSIRDTQ